MTETVSKNRPKQWRRASQGCPKGLVKTFKRLLNTKVRGVLVLTVPPYCKQTCISVQISESVDKWCSNLSTLKGLNKSQNKRDWHEKGACRA